MFVRPPFEQITFKLGNFTNLKALFPGKLMDFPELVHVKSWKKMCKGLLHMWCVTFLMMSFFRFQNIQALRRIPRFWLSLSIGFLMLSKDLDSSISLWFSYFLTCNELLVLTRKKQQLSTLHVKTLHKNRFQERAHVYSFCHVVCVLVILLARYVI